MFAETFVDADSRWHAYDVDRSVSMTSIIGAIGGVLVRRGFDRGEQERHRLTEAIISRRSAPPV